MFTFNILHVEARTHRTDAEELAALPGHLFRLLWLALKHLACNICNVLHISWNANLILWTCAVLAWQQSSVTLTFNNVSTLHVSTYTWSQLASELVVLALISKFTRNFQCLLVLAPPLNKSGTTPAGVVPLLFKGGARTNKPTNQQMLKVSAVSDRETAGWYYMIFIADMNPEEMFPHVEVVVWITVDTNKTSIQEILSGTKWVTTRFDLNTFRRSLHSFTCINTPQKIWHQGVQHYSVLVGMSTRCLVGRFYLRLWFPVIPVFRSSSSSSSLAQLLGSMLFLEVDKAAGGLWDRSEGSDWRVTDPERWNSAFLLFIIIIIIPQIDDITETTTQTHELNVFTGGWK